LISSEPIELLKSELTDFLALKRVQLRALSEEVETCQQGQMPMSLMASKQQPSSTPSNEPKVMSPDSRNDSQPTEHEIDPMTRLNAIKQRLAKQIERH